MIILGIDPGLSGALCLMGDVTHHSEIIDIPTFSLSRNGKNKREVDAIGLSNAINEHLPIKHCFIEQVGAMPGQGVSSVFAFGKSYGVIIGVLAARGIPVTYVHPRVWKKALGVPAAKDGARARASQLLPRLSAKWSRAKDDGRAEAALIAYWGIEALKRVAA